MSYTKTNVELEEVTHELAVKISTMRGLPGERELRRDRVRFLRDHIAQGTFIGPTWAIAKCRDTGEIYRTNGQHSGYVLASLTPEEFPKGLLATLETFEFDSIAEDAAALFNLFDHPKSARSNKDLMGIYRARHPELAPLSNKFLVDVAQALDFHTKNGKEKGLSARQYGLYFNNEEHRAFAVWLHQWNESPNRWLISRTGVVAQIFPGWREDRSAAEEFWGYSFNQYPKNEDHEAFDMLRTFQEWYGNPNKHRQTQFLSRAKKVWTRYVRLREASATNKTAA